MLLRVCSVSLIFTALLIGATDPQELDACNKQEPDPAKMWKQDVVQPNSSEKTTEEIEQQKGGKEEEKTGSKRIFIYNPYLGYHHIHFMTTIANALDAAGHQVTMLDSLIYPDLKQPKRRESIRVLTVEQNAITRKIAEDGESEKGLKSFWSEPPLATKVKAFFSFYKSVTGFSSMMAAQCEDVLKSDALKTLQKESYDLAITEVFDFCGVGLNNVMDVKKTILASSVPLHEYIGEKLGLPMTFDIVPTKFTTTTTQEHRENFDRYERSGLVKNILESAILGQNIFGYLDMKESAVFQSQFPEIPFPGFEKLLRSAHSLIENVHPLLDLSKPTLNAIIPIGGITIYKTETEQYSDKEAAEMEKIMKKISNAKKHNSKVVLVSFGTVMDISTMKDEIKENILAAFKDVENTIFIWKAKRELLSRFEIPSNVHLYDWLPQSDILASGEIDLFVSHMGIGSMTEAAFSGVPMIAVPIFVDQHYNFASAKRLKIADFVDKYSLASTSEALRGTILKELNSGAMKTNSKKLANSLRKFGNQTKRMLDHIAIILSLPDDTESVAFHNHHQGMNLMLSVRSLLHFVPYYAVPVTIVLFIISFFNLGYIAWCCGRGLQYVFSKNQEPPKASGIDLHRNNNDAPIGIGITKTSTLPAQTPKEELSFDTVICISVAFYCSLFIILALGSSYFSPFVVYSFNNFPKSSNIFIALVVFFFSLVALNVRSRYFRAVSQFTTSILLAFSTIIIVLSYCTSYASYMYHETRS